MKLITLKNNIVLFLIGLLILVWPMPHVIAIRNIDIILLFIFTFINYLRHKDKFIFTNYTKILFYLIIAFILWAIFISLISPFKNYCLKELYGQFTPPILLLFSSFFIINSDFYKIKNKIFITIFSMLMIFPIYHFLYSLHFFLIHHYYFPFRSYGITVGLDELNFMMPYILAFFAVEIIFRLLNKKSLLPISNSFLALLMLINLFSLFVQAKRNGIISIVFLIISVIFFVKLIHKSITKKFIIVSLIGILLITSLIYLNFKEDKRWNTFIATAKLVFIQNSMADLNFKGPLPKLPDGTRANQSNYERMLMIREGIKLIIENPLGYGYARNIYGKAISKKYHIHNATHSHSGVIDWGIGLGVMGLILWSGICFLIIYISFKNFLMYQSYYALLALFLTTSFYFRMFLDSINKDHMLQQFVFFTSLTFFAMQKEIYEKNNLSSP